VRGNFQGIKGDHQHEIRAHRLRPDRRQPHQSRAEQPPGTGRCVRRQAGGHGDPPGQARPGEGHFHPPLYRLSGDDRGGAAHSGGHCHGERNPRGDRPLLHRPRRQRHHRKAH
ncbi:Cupin domain-containing protein, partial [Dysosmobacter welbionis]